MPGLFQGLELGKRAMLTHQLTLQTIAHNIANVNTPGYSRQRISICATRPELSATGAVGTGVQALDIRHIRDLFLGEQFRQNSKSLGQWSYKEKTLSQVEALFSEPNENTLSDQMNKFWNAWSDLSTDPSSMSSREAVLGQANLLVNSFHELASQLYKLQDATDRDLVNLTSEVNRFTGEIASLNHQIKQCELGTGKANDLRDERDLILDKLAAIIDVNTIEDTSGDMTVYLGAMAIVSNDEAIGIKVDVFNDRGHLKHVLAWKGTSITIKNLNGQIKGLLDSRDEIIPRYLEELNKLSSTIVEEVNALHSTGYALDGSTGTNFFDTNYTDAATIRINPEIINNLAKISSASIPDAESDNTIALAIADLRNSKVMGNNTTSIDDFYNGLVGTMGVEVHESQSFTSRYELLANQIEDARQSVQGVSLDEEMTAMIKSQHAYDAAARIITTMDEALDTVIHGMGRVGR
ncbi:MAG: flagellar hook-associated protein FlgK [candidate division Zixibacteria bacterium]|nr:flagellar hook-associated protein FlgK [candidate division Zixibacteria bacterium]